MKELYGLKEKLNRELKQIAGKPELSAGDLEVVHKLTDTVKNIDKITMLEDDNGYSERMQRRDSRGRYSRHDGRWEPRRSYGGENYSMNDEYGYVREEGKERILRELGEMMEDADGEQRRILEHAMRNLRNA